MSTAATLAVNLEAFDVHDDGVEEITVATGESLPEITILVPTRNEASNIERLLHRLFDDLGDRSAEVLFVDDSDDGTVEAIRQVAPPATVGVRLLHRERGDRRGGLGGAVAAGLRCARAEWVVIMDGDLQHPPELARRLVDVGRSREVDIVIASRYVAAEGPAGLDGTSRRAVSGSLTALTKVVFPRRLACCSDPLSGFFAVRRAAVNLDRLRPSGFKVLLEILVRTPRLRIAEVPFTFAPRHAGTSKASPREGMRFLTQVLRLRALVFSRQVKGAARPSRSAWLARALAFGLVGLSGVVVNMGVLWLLTRPSAHVHYLVGAALATEASTTWLFVLTEALVFRGPKPRTLVSRGVRFYLLNHVALLLRLPILALLVEDLGLKVLAANFVTLVLLFLVRFLVADSAIYGQRASDDPPSEEFPPKEPMRLIVEVDPASPSNAASTPVKRSRRRTDYLPYRYAIADLLTVGSQVALPELEYFRAPWLGTDLDITIRVGSVGGSAPDSRATMTQFAEPAGVRYTEHLGALGANFRITLGEPIEIVAAPMLARSPHVLYTNVLEALLRFVLVSRGAMLLHSACLELDGHGLLLSARTDTGKTGTVLRLVREKGAKFLSDDMTIIYPDGRALCFPKPLTISHHTLRAVQAGDLTAREWRRLRIQSRLHSKEGRSFAMMLSQLNIPIMWINSMIQVIVPPPKYMIDRLVPCTVIRETTVRDLFIIERSPEDLAEVGHEAALETLLVNTDDAYGFPPFRQFAPSVVIDGLDYLALRAKERAILDAALGNIRARQVATPDYTWADRIPELLAVAGSGDGPVGAAFPRQREQEVDTAGMA